MNLSSHLCGKEQECFSSMYFLMHLREKKLITMDFAECIFIFLSNETVKQETFIASLEILIIYKDYPSPKCLSINGQYGQLVVTRKMSRPLMTAHHFFWLIH